MSKSDRVRRMLEQIDPTALHVDAKTVLESRVSRRGMGPALDVRRTNTEAVESELALESLDVLRRGGPVDSEQRFVLEAIVMPYYRPVIDIVDDDIVRDQLTSKWEKLGRDLCVETVKRWVRGVGRIDVPNIKYAGTGFLVGDGLLMTNRHVAAFFAQGLGLRPRVGKQPGQSASVDFYHENGKSNSEAMFVEDVIMIHPACDMALIKIRGLPPNREPLKLSTADPTTLAGREVVVIGYPGYDPEGDQEFQRVQSRIFRDTYFVKRFQPGIFKSRATVESYQRTVDVVSHDCSTLGGNSGSAVIDLSTGHVVGLHFMGSYLVANYAVSAFDLARDSRVVDAGVEFAGPRLDPTGDFYGDIWRANDSAETLSQTRAADRSPILAATTTVRHQMAAVDIPQLTATGNTVRCKIPIHVSVSVGVPTSVSSPVTAISDGKSKAREGLFSQTVAIVPDSRFRKSSLAASGFDWQTALSLGLATRLSYQGEAAVRATALSTWGCQTCEFIEMDDTQCFVAVLPDAVLVAFRGTESLGDWLSNLNMVSTTRGYGVVHRGFLGAFQVVDQRLRAELSKSGSWPVLLTGHSLGGALATLAAAEWHGQVPVSSIYTFGQPAVGKGEFPVFMRRNYSGKIFRFVNDDDIVPRVPPTYGHVGTLMQCDSAGQWKSVHESPVAESASGSSNATAHSIDGPAMLTEAEFDHLRAQMLEQRANTRATGVESLASPSLEGLIPSVSDHSLERYLAKIAAVASS